MEKVAAGIGILHVSKMCGSNSKKLCLLLILVSLTVAILLLIGRSLNTGPCNNPYQISCPTAINIPRKKISPDLGKFLQSEISSSNCSYSHIPNKIVPTCSCNTSENSFSAESNQTISDAEYARWAKDELSRQFQPSITQQEKARFMEALKVLTNSLDLAGIKYFMFGGTLIGSWRHHAMIPWDDDVDIVVNDSDRSAVENLKFANYTMNTKDSFRYRFMCNDGVPSRGEISSKWPFIDIVFFGDNGTHIHNMWKPMSNIHVYHISDILPLRRRPFGDLALYAPHKPLVIVNNAAEVCMTREWSHRDVLKLPQIYTADCKLLHGIYPFVMRNSESNAEHLYLDGQLLHTVNFLPG